MEASIDLLTQTQQQSESGPDDMICRACLRATMGAAAAAADALPAQRLLLRAAAQRRSLCSAKTGPRRATSLLHPLRSPQISPSHATTSDRRFSTSAALSSDPGQTQDTSAPAPSGGLEKPSYLSEGESQVWDRLVAEFAPTQLVVQDISGGCGSMYGIEICSDKFRGLTMLKQQRLVNAALGDLMKDWHGLQLKTRSP